MVAWANNNLNMKTAIFNCSIAMLVFISLMMISCGDEWDELSGTWDLETNWDGARLAFGKIKIDNTEKQVVYCNWQLSPSYSLTGNYDQEKSIIHWDNGIKYQIELTSQTSMDLYYLNLKGEIKNPSSPEKYRKGPDDWKDNRCGISM